MLASASSGGGGVDDPNPLQPPATSSPRDTLQSFLTNANQVAEKKRQLGGAFDAASYQVLRRAAHTMDFSATPHGDDWSERILRVALLHEVLGRVALPPEAQIPGEKAATDSGLTNWSIPGTQIRIERVETGPRAGEFLFSAETVAAADRLYRRAKQLPYRADATPGVYERVASLVDADGIYERLNKLQQRLKPVDTSSPRATLQGFLDRVNRAHALVIQANAALSAEPPTMSKAEARAIEDRAARLLERAAATLDLSRVPKALRVEAGEEAALMLKEVFDRLLLPPLDAVPDERMVAAAREGALGPFVQATGPLRWRIPNTEIEIVEITEGDRQGEFLFSAVTVADIGEAYQSVRDLPYRKDAFGGTELDYRSPGVSAGFYDYFVSTPGHLVPRTRLSGELIDRLPEWLKALYGGQTVWQWIALLLSLLVTVLAAVVLMRWIRRLSKQAGPPVDGFVRILSPVSVAILVTVVLAFLEEQVNITGGLLTSLAIGGKAIVLAMAVWAVFALCKAVAETVIASPRTRINEDSIDATMWRIGARILGFLVGVAILVRGMQILGADLVPLLAGLGVGGLAVALAAQGTLTDVFGSLMILADRPYRIGHWVKIGDKEGTVESIGIRSTRIRTFYDSVLSIPNSKAVSSIVDNMGRRRYRRVRTQIGIRYDTPPERIEAFLEGIKRIIQTNQTTRKDYFHVVLNDFGPDHLVVLLYFFVKVPDWSAELVERQRIFLEIIRLADSLGVAFAFPTQTLEVESFPGQPGREPPAAASAEELRAIAESYASTAGAGRPRGLGIFVPPHEER
jgi:MscS family membrane protein